MTVVVQWSCCRSAAFTGCRELRPSTLPLYVLQLFRALKYYASWEYDFSCCFKYFKNQLFSIESQCCAAKRALSLVCVLLFCFCFYNFIYIFLSILKIHFSLNIIWRARNFKSHLAHGNKKNHLLSVLMASLFDEAIKKWITILFSEKKQFTVLSGKFQLSPSLFISFGTRAWHPLMSPSLAAVNILFIPVYKKKQHWL